MDWVATLAKEAAANPFAKVATQSMCSCLTTTFGILCVMLTPGAGNSPFPRQHTGRAAARLRGGPGRAWALLAQCEPSVRCGRFLLSRVHPKGGFVAAC